MDDTFLHSLHESPSPEFAHKLRARLRHRESQPSFAFGVLRLHGPILKASIAAMTVAILALVLTVPAVRAGAQAFLDLFRVVNFAAVKFDDSRMEQLKLQSLDLPQLLGEQIEV